MVRRRSASAPALRLLLSLAAGCMGTTGHLAVATTRTVNPSDPLGHAPPRHVVGRSCIDLIVVFPTAMPNFGDAIEDALRQGGGHMLTDVTIGYEILYLPPVYGIACYVVEGDAR
jgi:hypothetical protein